MTFSTKWYWLLPLLGWCISCQTDKIQPTRATCSLDYAPNDSHPKNTANKALLERYVKQGIPGIALLIADKDGLSVQAAGMADIEQGVNLQPCHIGKLGSITKMMLGSLTWMLIEEGKYGLSIDDKLSKWRPDIAEKLTHGDKITLATLINHTAGVYDVARDLNYNLAVINHPEKAWTMEEIVAYSFGKPANGMPGDSVHYSNIHTLLEAMIIEKATGRKHGDLLRERIFEPLGMKHTLYYDYSTTLPDSVIQGYVDFHNTGKGIQNISSLNPGSGNGYTGVYSTVGDLYKFMNALLGNKTLISQNSLDNILGSFRLSNPKDWASSIGGIHHDFLDGNAAESTYGHGGGDIGYSAGLYYYPSTGAISAYILNYGTNLPSEIGDLLAPLRRDINALSVK